MPDTKRFRPITPRCCSKHRFQSPLALLICTDRHTWVASALFLIHIRLRASKPWRRWGLGAPCPSSCFLSLLFLPQVQILRSPSWLTLQSLLSLLRTPMLVCYTDQWWPWCLGGGDESNTFCISTHTGIKVIFKEENDFREEGWESTEQGVIIPLVLVFFVCLSPISDSSVCTGGVPGRQKSP